jgi:hypothetical protein
MDCSHIFKFQYVVYSNGHQLSGSSAKARYYEDVYYCKKCLHVEYRNKREYQTSYSDPLVGTLPK